MKRVLNGLGAALSVGALLATIGCDSIRDYSVNSYQGVMPVSDTRPTGSLPPNMLNNSPKPSVPAQPPEAAPSATAESPTKPASSNK